MKVRMTAGGKQKSVPCYAHVGLRNHDLTIKIEQGIQG